MKTETESHVTQNLMKGQTVIKTKAIRISQKRLEKTLMGEGKDWFVRWGSESRGEERRGEERLTEVGQNKDREITG